MGGLRPYIEYNVVWNVVSRAIANIVAWIPSCAVFSAVRGEVLRTVWGALGFAVEGALDYITEQDNWL